MKKNLLFFSIIIFVVVLLCVGVKVQSVDDYYQEHLDDIKPGDMTVFLEIECVDILNNYELLDKGLKDSGIVPNDGVVLANKEYILRNDDTPYNILLRATKASKISIVTQSSQVFGTMYVQSIAGISEKGCGVMSGWMCFVNDEAINVGISQYKLKNKDKITIKFVCDYTSIL